MVHWTIDDKKAIASAQKQMVYEKNVWGYESNRVTGYRCKRCHNVFNLDNLEVDHIVPRAKKGTDRPSNLQLLCSSCNRKKSDTITAKAKALIKRASSATKKTATKATTKTKVKSLVKRSVTRKPAKRTVTKAATKSPVRKTATSALRKTTKK